MTDTFQKHGRSPTSPPEQAAAVPADDRDPARVPRGTIRVGGTGDLHVHKPGGAEPTLAAVSPSG